MQLLSGNVGSSELVIKWAEQSEALFHAIWLRDNCSCAQCGDPAIGRRTLRLSDLELDVTVKDIDILNSKGQDELHITWSDQHQSVFPESWLRTHRYDKSALDTPESIAILWTDDFRANLPVFEYSDIIGKSESLLKLLITIRDHGLCLIENSPAEAGVLEDFALRVGYPQESNFGRIQDLVVDKGKRSIANDVTELKPHTDEPYRASPPGILMFHCIETDIHGQGQSIFLDGFAAAEGLRQEDEEGFNALCKHNQSFRRHFEGEVDLITAFPTISVDSAGNICGVRINDRVAAPPRIDPQAVPVYYKAMRRLLQLCEEENRLAKHTLRPGDIVAFDNHRILHGRTRLTLNGRRWLQWAQIDRGDFHSTLRILADKLNINRSILPFPRGAYG